mmetsp:Transcript_27739/g.36363  ORF Transcript_27739/g.36363 Transcript_27739/m.36363 type:complete len:451 (+) Transcript_27739:152-1504(+)
MASLLEQKDTAVIVVDPISSGRELARKLINRDFPVVAVWSVASQSVEGIGDCDVQFGDVVYEIEGDIKATIASIERLPFKFLASMVGCESGVELNDLITEFLSLHSNGTNFSEARRDKWIMQERIKESGLRGIKQSVASTFEEVNAFVSSEQLRKWIMKPRRDAGSNGVYMCKTLEEAKRAFEKITESPTIFGEKNNDVLVQECLEGTEYVIDTVSCKGEHKVAAIWEQDKRTLHGSPFVYYDSHLFESQDGFREQEMAEYVFNVLDSLGVKYGPAHAEVMWLEDEDVPCLIEVGTRPHGAGGNFPDICDPTIGYNQLDVTIDAYLFPTNFDTIPKRPGQLQGTGVEYFFVCYEDGILESTDFTKLAKLESYIGVDMHRSNGDTLEKTTDLITSPGVVRLTHPDKELVNREKMELRLFERSLFQIRPHITNKTIEVESQEENVSENVLGN